MLSFCLIGISIVDQALLKKTDYVHGRISYKRRKTGKWYDIKVVPLAEIILNYYSDYSDFFLLPVTDEIRTEEQQIVGIKSKTKIINKYLNKIGDLIKSDLKITTYLARHTWATTAKRLGYSNDLITEVIEQFQ